MLLFYNLLTRPADRRSEKSSQAEKAFKRNEGGITRDHHHAGSTIEHPTGNFDTSHLAAD